MSATMDTLQEKVELETASPVDSTYTLAVSNVTALTEGPSVNATVPLQSELALWLKADVGVTTNSSGLVSAWADQSGYGNDAVQADASVNPVFQPTYMGNGMNGMPAVRFVNSAGISNYMEVPYSPSMSMSPNFTVFEVIKFDNASKANTMLSRAVANAAAPIDLYQQGSTVKCYRGNAEQPGGSYGSAQSTNGLASNAPGIIDAWAKGTNMLFYLNGVIAAGGYVLDGVRDSQEPTRLGSRDDWANPLTGNIAEVMLFRGAVSDEERLAINNYLGNKYGITVSDIVFTQQPKDTTKLEGQTATFAVQVLASSLNISYQWQENGTNMVGATNATYTTPILTPADSGEVYRVLVSVPGASQYSDTATLNVMA
ncbi:MAG TPA: hypothetical protein VFF11_03890, partial [Candidatus Binatia bacterium]|nr:hypothetical protein [Candidatus Binatia bacterium]